MHCTGSAPVLSHSSVQASLAVIGKGVRLSTDSTLVDERNIAWYHVTYNGKLLLNGEMGGNMAADEQGVILAGSQSLFLMLRLLELSWKQMQQFENQHFTEFGRILR